MLQVTQQQLEEVIDAALLHLEPALHVALAEGELGIEDEMPLEPLVGNARGDKWLSAVAVAMRNAPTCGSFELRGLQRPASAEVLGESRTLSMANGKFEDEFQPYAVHLYRIPDP